MMTICPQAEAGNAVFSSSGFVFPESFLSFITGSFFILLRWCNAEGNSGYLPNERRSHYNKEEEGERDWRKGGTLLQAGCELLTLAEHTVSC